MLRVFAAAFLPLTAAQNCIDPATFTLLNLDQLTGPVTVTQNNLGGVGPGGGAQELYYRNVGSARLPGSPFNGVPIDLRVRAISDYRAANNGLNGFGQAQASRFGVINLRAPGAICPSCTGIAGQWHPELTFTDFQFEIINQLTGQVLDVTSSTFKTFVTFYDFDTLGAQTINGVTGSLRAIECVMADSLTGSVNTILHSNQFGQPDTQLVEYAPQDLLGWVVADGTHNVGGAANPVFTANSRLYCASQFGIGADNPADPLNLSPLEAQRSMHVEINNVASFTIRYVLRNGPSVSGRNFMYGGRPNLPLCVPPPPVIVAADPHFAAAHGDTFDFKGRHQIIYNILSHQSLSLNAFFEHVDYREAGQKHRLVHGSYMRAVYVTFAAPSGKVVRIEYAAKTGKYVKHSLIDAAGATVTEEKRERLASGWKLNAESGCSLAFDGQNLAITTPEWTVAVANRVKPGIVGATSCATGKCFLEVSLTPSFDADHAAVAPHGLIGQSYDADNYGIIGNTDSYLTRGNETSTEAMGEGAIEGVAADYEMPDKYATAFKFSRFGKTTAPPRDTAALTGKRVPRINVQTAKMVEGKHSA